MKKEIYDICEKEATTTSTPILISFSNHNKNKKEVIVEKFSFKKEVAKLALFLSLFLFDVICGYAFLCAGQYIMFAIAVIGVISWGINLMFQIIILRQQFLL